MDASRNGQRDGERDGQRNGQRGGQDKPLALVAGGSRGLGLAIARELGRAGHRVVITARTSKDLERARDELTSEGLEVETRVHDVREADQARDLVSALEFRYGPIETLIVVAGVLKVGPLPDRAEAYDEPIDIMLRGPINMVHAVLPSMRERGRGRIGVVSSIAAIIPTPHLVPYTAAKYGALGFTRGLSEELRNSGITVSAIIPGLMRTGGHWHADYTGHPEQEYAWFTALSSMPLVSMDAQRAARIIVRGVLAGRSKIIFTLPARFGELAFRLSPTLVTRLLGVADRLLPKPGNDQAPGYQAAAAVGSPTFERLTVLGRRAVQRFNQVAAHFQGPGRA